MVEIVNYYGIDGNSLVSIEANMWKERVVSKEKNEQIQKEFLVFLNFCSQKRYSYQLARKEHIPEFIICEELYIIKGFWKKRKVRFLLFLFLFLFLLFYFYFYYFIFIILFLLFYFYFSFLNFIFYFSLFYF